MPGGQGYPKDRVAMPKYETGGVEQGNAPKDIAGKESVHTERVGKEHDPK
jgi:hypothetical protein